MSSSNIVAVGLDMSMTGAGYVLLDLDGKVLDNGVFGTEPDPRLAHNKYLDKARRRRRIVDHLLGRFHAQADARLVFAMEDYGYFVAGKKGKNAATTNQQDLAELGGVMKDALIDHFQFPLIVSTSQVKKYALGKGSGEGIVKEKVPLAVYKLWGVEFKTNDEVDAYVLAQIRLGIVWKMCKDERAEQLRPFQVEVIEALKPQLLQ